MTVTYTTLISATELARDYDPSSWSILDCRFTLGEPRAGEQAYLVQHIAGAQYLDLERHASAPIARGSGRHPWPLAQDIAMLLGERGTTPQTQVVVYDDASGAMAARTWLLLRWLGHQSVAVLDGGLQAWVAEGRPLSADPGVANDRGPYPFRREAGYMVSADEVLTNIGSGSFCLVDARAGDRFAGVNEPIDRVAGHIPNAVNRPMGHNLTSNGKFKSSAALRTEWQSLVGDKATVMMCGSGVTACHNMLSLAIAGLPFGRLYAGSWSEWIEDPARPIAVG